VAWDGHEVQDVCLTEQPTFTLKKRVDQQGTGQVDGSAIPCLEGSDKRSPWITVHRPTRTVVQGETPTASPG